MKVVIKTAEASIECKGLHDLDELDWSKLFSFADEGMGRRGSGQGERDTQREMERQREREEYSFFFECVLEMLGTIALLNFPIIPWSC